MITNKDILNLEKRKEIYRHIEKNPGLHIREITRRINIPKTTLMYHINYLKKLELIEEKQVGKHKLYFASGKIGTRDKELLGLLRNEITCNIFLHLLFSGACSQKELSKELETSPATITRYIKKMLNMGIIEEAPLKDGIIFTHEGHKRPIFRQFFQVRKPIGSEKFYRRKNYEIIDAVYKLLILHKQSLSNEDTVSLYINLVNSFNLYYDDLISSGKKIATKQITISDRINSFTEFMVEEIFRPPFCA